MAKSPEVKDIVIALLVEDVPIATPVSKINYHDAALFYGVHEGVVDDAKTEQLLGRFHNVTKTAPASPANGNRASKGAYAALATLHVERVTEALASVEDGFDACVRYKMGDVEVCDVLLDCHPLIVVGTEIVCSVGTILWNGRPPFGRDEAAQQRGEVLASKVCK